MSMLALQTINESALLWKRKCMPERNAKRKTLREPLVTRACNSHRFEGEARAAGTSSGRRSRQRMRVDKGLAGRHAQLAKRVGKEADAALAACAVVAQLRAVPVETHQLMLSVHYTHRMSSWS